MISKMRAWARGESAGVVVPVVFVLLYGLWQVTVALATSFVLPVVSYALDSYDSFGDVFLPRLEFTIGEVGFDWTGFFVYSIAFVLLSGIAYVLFLRPIAEDGEIDDGMRECPECKSEIVVDARRCRFCTASIEPLIGDAREARA